MTMAMLAEKLGVAQSTVSRALANHPSISEEQRSRIQEAATEYGYRPNPMVSALMAGRRHRTDGSPPTIALLHYAKQQRDPPTPIWPSQYTDAIRDRCVALGYRLEPLDPVKEGLSADRVSLILRTRGVQGVIIGPGLPNWFGDGRPFADFSLATYGSLELQAQLHTALLDYYQGMTLALTKIAGAGKKRVLFCFDETLDRRLAHRWLAASRIHRELAPQLSVLEWPFIWDQFDGQALLKTIREEKIEVVLTHARLLPRALNAAGMLQHRKPWLVGLNPFQEFPEQSSIVDNRAAVGAAAVDLVVGQLHRHERGFPETPKLVLTENGWNPGGADDWTEG